MNDAEDDAPLDFRGFLAVSVMVLSGILLLMTLPIWPLLGMVSGAVGAERIALRILMYSPLMLAAAILLAFASRRLGSWLLLAIAACLPLSVLAALAV